MQDWQVGVALDSLATLAGAGGKCLLRHAAVTRKHRFYFIGIFFTAIIDPALDVRHAHNSSALRITITALIKPTARVTQLAAYSFAAQSIIAAMAGLVVVWNVLLAPCMLGERVTCSRGTGAALICSGTLCIGVFGNHEEVDRTPEEYIALFARPAAVAYYCGYALWAMIAVGMFCRSSSAAGAYFLCAFGGSLAGNSFSTKAAVELTECGALDPGCPSDPFASPHFFLFGGISLLTASLSLYLLAVSLQGYEALSMITLYQALFVLSGTISGNIVMNEKANQSWSRLSAYWTSVAIVLGGLYILMRGELSASGSSRVRDVLIMS